MFNNLSCLAEFPKSCRLLGGQFGKNGQELHENYKINYLGTNLCGDMQLTPSPHIHTLEVYLKNQANCLQGHCLIFNNNRKQGNMYFYVKF